MSEGMFNPQDILKFLNLNDAEIIKSNKSTAETYTKNLKGVDFKSAVAQNKAAEYFSNAHSSMFSGSKSIFSTKTFKK